MLRLNRVKAVALAAAMVGFAVGNNASAADFYQGKTITIVVPYSAGGSYDLLSRLASQYMPKYIPGRPNMVVQNREGGAAQVGLHAAYTAQPDGLTMIHFAAPVAVQALLGLFKEIDYTKWEWLGSVGGAFYFMALRSELGLDTPAKIRASNKEIFIGTLGAGNQITESAQFLKSVGRYNLKLIPGFPGYEPMSLAVRRGELDGLFTALRSWADGNTREMAESGFLKPVMIVGGGLPTNQEVPPNIKNLPKFSDEITDPQDKIAFDSYFDLFKMTRPFAVTPGTPKDRVAILEKALWETMQDKEFLAAAEKASFDVSPFTGAQAKQVIDKMFAMPQPVRDRLKQILSTQ
jgi:tripartite-type tricarboxylate transporter receptor subunit TctC